MRNSQSVLSLTLLRLLVVLAAACLALPGRAGAPLPNGGWDAAFSPDGGRIAFTSGSPHGIPNLWVVRTDRSGLKQLTIRGAHEPRWLPDGKTIVFGTIRNGKSTFMAIDPDAQPGSEKLVEALPAGAEDPVWSPNGALVAYGLVSKDGNARDLMFARTGGGGATGMTSNFWCREWAWSPDGGTIAFIVGRSAGGSIWLVDTATRDVRMLYKGYCRALAYSPDGKKLAFAVPDVHSGFKIDIVDLATGKEQVIPVATFGGEKIIWAPDGRRFYFVSSHKAEPAVWTVGADGKDITRLTPAGTMCAGPALSPDGKTFVCHGQTKRSYGAELFVYNVSGKMLAALTPDTNPSFWSPVWSPDGSEFAFESDVNHATELFLGTPSGRMSKAYTQISSPDTAEVSWFGDGKELLLTDGNRVKTVQRAGGKDAVKPLPKVTTAVQSARLNGGEVIFTEWGIRDATISAVKLDGSGKRLLTQKPKPVPQLRLDHQGRPGGASPVPAGPHGDPMSPHGDQLNPHAISQPRPQPDGQPAQPQRDQHAATTPTQPGGSSQKAASARKHSTVVLATYQSDVSPAPVKTVADSTAPAASDPHAGMNMGTPGAGDPHAGMNMGTPGAGDPHAGMNMGSATGTNPHAGMDIGSTTGAGDPHAGMDMGTATGGSNPHAGMGIAPVPDTATGPQPGNPHAGLGMLGPQENLAPAEPPVLDLYPAVTPDHKTVAFVRNDQVWLVNADGTNERQVTKLAHGEKSTRTVGSLSWSPDGKTALFTAFYNDPEKMTFEIWTCTAEPGSERLIDSEDVNSEYGVYYSSCTSAPVFTPDGKRILFTSVAGEAPRIASIAPDGSDLRELVPAPAVYPALDPTGSKLAYVDLSDFHERIRVLDLATGNAGKPLFRK